MYAWVSQFDKIRLVRRIKKSIAKSIKKKTISIFKTNKNIHFIM